MCGDLSSEVVHCPNCNEDVPKTLYCLNCGYPLYKMDQQKEAEARVEAETFEAVTPEEPSLDMDMELELPYEISETVQEQEPEIEEVTIEAEEPEIEIDVDTEDIEEPVLQDEMPSRESIMGSMMEEVSEPVDESEEFETTEEITQEPSLEPETLEVEEEFLETKYEEEGPETVTMDMQEEIAEPEILEPEEEEPITTELEPELSEEAAQEEVVPVMAEPEIHEQFVSEEPIEESPPEHVETDVSDISEPVETVTAPYHMEMKPDLMSDIKIEFAPDPLTKEVMENLAKNITLKIRLVRLLRDKQVKEETFKKLFDSYVEQGKLWVSRREEIIRRFSSDIERMEHSLVTARKDYELLEIRKSIGDADDEEYGVKAPAFRWDIEHLETEIKNRKAGLIYVDNLKKLCPEEEIVELRRMADNEYKELDSIEGVATETIAKIKESLADALNSLES
jgi:hypothetical protein